jgi:hypothetical protein
MHWILDLDISRLVSGIARKHGIMPKPFLGHPQYSPPPKKNPFSSKNKRFLKKESLWLLKLAITRKYVNHANLFGGAILLFPPQLAPQIQYLPVVAEIACNKCDIAAISAASL